MAGLSVGDVVSECRLNQCHLVGQPLFKYQDDARSNTHKIVRYVFWLQFCNIVFSTLL